MRPFDLETMIQKELRERQALIILLSSKEDFLIQHGVISRRACISKNSLKNGRGPEYRAARPKPESDTTKM